MIENMQTPKGMRDFIPKEMINREKIIEKLIKVFRKYGYQPLGSPAIEKLDVLTAKAGEEIKGQIFRIEESDLGLRFDLTIPLARIASNNAFPKPFKRYCIAPVWRREEPQKGRFREFWQADIDIVGTKGMRAEAEILTIVGDMLETLGFRENRILLNNRKILNSLAKKVDIENKKENVFRELDKLDKLGEKEVRKNIEEIIGKKRTRKFFSYIIVDGDNNEKLNAARKIDEEGTGELEEIINLCPYEIEIDLTLVRGLGYYTGPIFEVKLSKEMGSVAGGGRYDQLLELYGQKDYSVGIGIGLERIISIMEKNKTKTYTKVFIASVKGYYEYGLTVAQELRKQGIKVEGDLNERNIRKQFDYANSLDIPWVIVVGEKEEKAKKVTLRDMKTGKEEFLSLKEATSLLVGTELTS